MATGILPVEPDLPTVLNELKRDVMISMNCHHVGIIQSFKASELTAEVSIAYKRVFNGVPESYPLIIDCPVIVLGGQTKRIEIPVTVGDECLVLFNDRDIKTWLSSGQVSNLNTQRLHNFSDAIAIVGLHSLGKKIATYDNTRVALVNDTTIVSAGASKVKVANASKDLLGVINALVDLVDTLNTKLTIFATTAATDPIAIVTATAATTLQTDLAAITLQLAAYKLTESGGLLE